MRLRRLDLIRYGHFTDYVLELGAKPANTSDFHIVYGPNEAGKSTAFEGYLDFLFGIPSRSGYNFLHDYNSMRIGACLEQGEEPLELVRIKKKQNDLLDAQENPVNKAVLSQALGGLGRDEYRAMFSLDDVSIEAGGNEILSSRGNLGELLFSAASGLSELGNILTEAKAEADLFHKKSARKTVLAEARRELKSLAQAIKEIDMDTGRFKALQKAHKLAQKQQDAAKEACDQLHIDKEKIAGLLDCLPQWHRRSDLQQQLSGLPEIDGFEPAWLTQAQDLQIRAAALMARQSSIETALADIKAQKQALKIDDAVLSVQQKLEYLLAKPYARAQTAAQDLPRRKQEKTSLEQEISLLAGQAGLRAEQAKNMTRPKLEALARLAREWEVARGKLTAAQQEATTAKQDLARIDSGAEMRAVSPDGMPLHVLLEHLEPDRLVSQWQAICDAETTKAEELAKALQLLAPWQGEADQLPLSVPGDAAVARLVQEMAQARQAVDLAADGLEQGQAEHAKLTARIAALRDQDRIKDAEQFDAVLQRRDDLWQRHLQSMSLASAKDFSDAMAEMDQLQEARLQLAKKMALLREWQLELAGLNAEVENKETVLDAKQARFDAARAEVNTLLQDIGLPEDFGIEGVPVWLELRLKVLEIRMAQKQLQERKSRLAQELAAAKEQLSAAFEAPKNADLRLLGRLAREKIVELVRQKEAGKALVAAQNRLKQRQENLQDCVEALAQVQQNWDAEITAQGLDFDPVEFNDALDSLRKLMEKQQKLIDLVARISAMQLDAQQFSDQIMDLAGMLSHETDADPIETARKLQQRLATAREALSRADTLETQQAEQTQHLQQVAKEQATLDLLLTDLRHCLGQGDAPQDVAGLVTVAMQAQKTAALREEIDRIEGQAFLRLGLSSSAEVQDALQGCDIATLRGRLEAIESALAEQTRQHNETIGDLRSATDALAAVGGDDAAARLQEKRQLILLELEEKAKQSLRLRLGVMVAHEALIQYRDSHRSNMLAQTEQAFVALTDGRYKALQTQSDGETETLLAIQAADNRAKLAQDMSKGTRFQLYLALRVAGYKQFAQSGVTLPFVADDIFETFDDTRTAAALKLLSEMGKTGQALYFTHHKHVVDLARQCLGDGCQIHELPAR